MTFPSTLLPMPAQTLALSRYDVACRAVAEAKAVDDIVEIVGQANAVHAYARQAKNRQMEIDAAEIRIRAERRLGELMAAQKATVGVAKGVLRRGVASTPREPTAPPTLAEAGIDKNLAKRAQSYAAVPPVQFEKLLTDKRQSGNRRVGLDPALIEENGALKDGEKMWRQPALAAGWSERAA